MFPRDNGDIVKLYSFIRKTAIYNNIYERTDVTSEKFEHA